MEGPYQPPMRGKPHLAVLFGGCFAYGAYQIGWPDPHADPVIWAGFLFCAGMAAKGGFTALRMAGRGITYGYHVARARRGEEIKGDARFLSARQARQEGLGDPENGPFIGLIGNQPIFAQSESASLILGPNGSGKTTREAVGRIAYTKNNLVAFDVKGELYALTADIRRKWHDNDVRLINPLLAESACLNPLDIICDAIEADDPDALSDASDFAEQLLPMPKGGGGANEFFIKGAQQLLEDCFLLICCVYGKSQANLGFVFEHLSDLDLLRRTVELASYSEKLNCEIALRANNLARGLNGDEEAEE